MTLCAHVVSPTRHSSFNVQMGHSVVRREGNTWGSEIEVLRTSAHAAGHWLHTDNPEGLLAILRPAFTSTPGLT